MTGHPTHPPADEEAEPPIVAPSEAPPEREAGLPVKRGVQPPSEAAGERDTVTVRRLAITAGILAGILATVVLGCSLIGQAELTGDSWDVIWLVRMERITAAVVVGVALATAGAALQSLLRNPLASPFVLGISSGAGVGTLLGATLAVSVGYAWAGTPAMAAAGGLLTLGAVYLIAQRRGRLDPYSLLLTGVIVNAFNGAIMLLIQLYASPYIKANYVSWLMGKIGDAPDRYLLISAGVITLAGWAYLFSRAHAFNVQSLGDDVAVSSGVSVARLRVGTFAAAGLMTAGAVALAGPISFVGLIVPHICRMVLGSDHRRLIIASGMVGGICLALADTFCRSTVLRFGGELPVGVITAMAGGPFFIVLLRRRLGETIA